MLICERASVCTSTQRERKERENKKKSSELFKIELKWFLSLENLLLIVCFLCDGVMVFDDGMNHYCLFDLVYVTSTTSTTSLYDI